MIEKEIRYKIDDNIYNKIITITQIGGEIENILDIVLGKDGFNSLKLNGYIIRIRQKGNKMYLESKKKIDSEVWEEIRVPLTDARNMIKILNLIGLNIYLYINRKRENRLYGKLKIFIDDVDLLGKYVEIEYQDSDRSKVKELLDILEINGEPEPLYGDIFKERINNDIEFRKLFDEKIKEIIG